MSLRYSELKEEENRDLEAVTPACGHTRYGCAVLVTGVMFCLSWINSFLRTKLSSASPLSSAFCFNVSILDIPAHSRTYCVIEDCSS